MNDRDEIAERLADAGYIADGELATAISLMQLLKRPQTPPSIRWSWW